MDRDELRHRAKMDDGSPFSVEILKLLKEVSRLEAENKDLRFFAEKDKANNEWLAKKNINLEAELKKRDQEIRCVAHGCDPPHPNDECRRLKCDRIIEQEPGRAKPGEQGKKAGLKSSAVGPEEPGPETPAPVCPRCNGTGWVTGERISGALEDFPCDECSKKETPAPDNTCDNCGTDDDICYGRGPKAGCWTPKKAGDGKDR